MRRVASFGLDFGELHGGTHTPVGHISAGRNGAKTPVRDKWVQSETRATSLSREAEMNNENDVTSESYVNPPSSATGVTRDGKFSSRILPAEGGRTRTFIPLARSESAGGAVRSPEGDPPRRPGQTWEGGDMGGGATPDRQH